MVSTFIRASTDAIVHPRLVVPGVQAVPGIQAESEPQIAADFKPDSMGGCSCVLCHVGCHPLTLCCNCRVNACVCAVEFVRHTFLLHVSSTHVR